MPAFTFIPALSWYAMLHAGPLRPLHTFMRTRKERFQLSRAGRFAPAVARAEVDLLARGVATEDQRSTVLAEPSRAAVACRRLCSAVSCLTPRRRYFCCAAFSLLTDALTAVADQHELRVANFHVAPRFVDAQAGEKRGRHEWWIELKMTTPAAPAPEVIAACLDVQLERRNDDYEAKRKGSGLELPWVRLVAPGTFEHWLRARGKWGEQNKMPRCRSDRG